MDGKDAWTGIAPAAIAPSPKAQGGEQRQASARVMLCRYLCGGGPSLPSSLQAERRALTQSISNHHQAEYPLLNAPCISFVLALLTYFDKRECRDGRLLSAYVPHASFITCSLRCMADATVTVQLLLLINLHTLPNRRHRASSRLRPPVLSTAKARGSIWIPSLLCDGSSIVIGAESNSNTLTESSCWYSA